MNRTAIRSYIILVIFLLLALLSTRVYALTADNDLSAELIRCSAVNHGDNLQIRWSTQPTGRFYTIYKTEIRDDGLPSNWVLVANVAGDEGSYDDVEYNRFPDTWRYALVVSDQLPPYTVGEEVAWDDPLMQLLEGDVENDQATVASHKTSVVVSNNDSKLQSLKVRRSSLGTLRVNWKTLSGADGYILNASPEGYSHGSENKISSTGLDVTGIGKGQAVYVSVAAYRNVPQKQKSGGYEKTQVWIDVPLADTGYIRTASVSYPKATVKVKKKIRIKTKKKHKHKKKKYKIKYVKKKVSGDLYAINKSKLGLYGVPQGAAMDGSYVYQIFEKQYKGTYRHKIAKYSISTLTPKKVSASMNLGHGNDMTYNKDDKRLVVAQDLKGGYRVRILHPGTLKVTATKTVTRGAVSSEQFGRIERFGGISYLGNGQYALKGQGNSGILITDRYFRGIRYIPTTHVDMGLNQGMNVIRGHYILTKAWSKGNIVADFNEDGKYVQRVHIGVPGEIESICLKGKTLYGVTLKWTYKLVKKKKVYYRTARFFRVKGIDSSVF